LPPGAQTAGQVLTGDQVGETDRVCVPRPYRRTVPTKNISSRTGLTLGPADGGFLHHLRGTKGSRHLGVSVYVVACFAEGGLSAGTYSADQHPSVEVPPPAQPPDDCRELLAQKGSSHHCALAGNGTSTPKHLQR